MLEKHIGIVMPHSHGVYTNATEFKPDSLDPILTYLTD
jgi:hypothetical protein